MISTRFLRSIRFRIAAWTSLAVATVAIVALVGLRQSIAWTLHREVDQVLVEDRKEVSLALSELGPTGLEAVADELRRKATGHAQHRWFVRLLDGQGEPVWCSEPSPARDGMEGLEPWRTTDERRIHSGPAGANALGVAHVQVGGSLALLRRDLARIDQIVAAASALLLSLAPLCGYWLSGLATRDLSAMSDHASRLRPASMGDRLPERGVGDELDVLARTVNGLLDRIAEFIEEKQSFLATAAHEMRTPLAVLRNSAEVALARDRTNDEYRDLIGELIEDSEALEVLVNQVLLLSEAVGERESTPRSVVPWGDVILRSIAMFQGVAESREITLEASVAERSNVVGVRMHLAQVVNNLIDNALKYTPPGGRVSVRLDASDGSARLVVADTGIGIAPEDVPRVFERFFRADRARTRDGVTGSGLGLSICQTIVHSHDGTIECRSVPGGGSEFEVRLPLAYQGAADPA
jgi:signal transduction histidine kinase